MRKFLIAAAVAALFIPAGSANAACSESGGSYNNSQSVELPDGTTLVLSGDESGGQISGADGSDFLQVSLANGEVNGSYSDDNGSVSGHVNADEAEVCVNGEPVV